MPMEQRKIIDIPLVQPRHRDVPLKLLSSRKFSDGVVRLNYAVPRATQTKRARKM